MLPNHRLLVSILISVGLYCALVRGFFCASVKEVMKILKSKDALFSVMTVNTTPYSRAPALVPSELEPSQLETEPEIMLKPQPIKPRLKPKAKAKIES